VPKTTRLTRYEYPNKPVWHIADILASHSKTASWEQPIVRNKEMWADYIQLAAGTKTPRVMYPDNRVAMIVWGDGQIRVSIDGQEPFIATKGFEINIPYRTPYSLEVVGDKPGLYFFVREAEMYPQYPADTNPDKPKDPPGYTYTKVIHTAGRGPIGRGAYGEKFYLDYYKDVVNNPSGRGGAFISDDHFFVNNIRGMGVPTPPPSNLGHFHADYTEFWFIIEGKMEHLIEGYPEVFKSEAGDVVTAAQGRFHRASFAAGQMDTRVAINPFPQGQHNFTVESGGRQ
jgi:mannose-6-phosphate isomerase-like protein (cupin superfamily)